jgi:hypothetical protein
VHKDFIEYILNESLIASHRDGDKEFMFGWEGAKGRKKEGAKPLIGIGYQRTKEG